MSLSPARAPLSLTEVEQFLLDPELGGDRERRLAGALAQIETTGTYAPTTLELAHGARLAWRNHVRSAAWRSVRVLDRRDRTTGDEVIAELVEHLTLATSNATSRPTVTVFAPGWRVHNDQLVRFAGWSRPDGTVLGDPRAVAATDLAISLGWPGPARRGAFDLLPIILSGPGHPPRTYDLPASAVFEVPVSHPRYSWLTALGLRWYALPAISNMSLALGGLSYSLAPFHTRYVFGRTGSRDLGDDEDCAALLPTIAQRMGLDMSDPTTHWRMTALIELDTAVRSSFDTAGFTIETWLKVESQSMARHDRFAVDDDAPPANPDPRFNPDAPASGGTFPDLDVRPNFVHHEPAPPATTSPVARRGVRDA